VVGFSARLVVSAFLVACTASHSFAQQAASAILGTGWQCLLVPTSFDGPGTIFSVSTLGEKSRIYDLNAAKLIVVHTGNAAFGKVTDKSKIKGEIVVSLLEKAIPRLGLELKAEGSLVKGATVEYRKVQEETTFEGEVNEVTEKWFKDHVTTKDGFRYFLVRDAYVAGEVTYQLTYADLVNVGGEAKFKSLFQAKVTVINHEGINSYELHQMLQPPLRVCIRASELLPTRGADAVVRYHLTDEAGRVPEISRSLEP
jgi:hypothetical protein